MTRRLALVLLAAAAALGAHHGYSAFDTKKEVTFDATVVEFHFTNSHSVIDFEVKDAAGAHKWQAELGSRRQLTIHGWTPTTLEPGTKLTISGHPARNGSKAIWATRILGPDGKEIRIAREN